MWVVFVWSFQIWQIRVVSGYRRSMGYLRVDCRAGVFALLDTLPKVSTLWETNIQQLKPSLRGLPGTRARYTGLTNTLEDAKNRLRCSFKGWILDQGHTLEELVDITTGIRARGTRRVRWGTIATHGKCCREGCCTTIVGTFRW